MRRLLVGTAALATLIACAHGGDSSSDSDSSEIINGERDTKANDAVVLLLSSSGSCTGTVVAPNLILTARHCVSKTDGSSICKADGTASFGGGVYTDKPASDMRVFAGVDAQRNFRATVPAPRAGRADKSARGKQLIVEDTDTYCSHDVAFLVLDRDMDVPVAPIRLSGGARPGEKLTAVGWGIIEDGTLATERKVREDIPVLFAGPKILGAGAIGIGASEFQVGESICQGDSGGPSFSSTGALVGVVSRGGNGQGNKEDAASGCRGSVTRNVYTHLGTKTELVTRAFEAAGHEPIPETPSADAGAPDGGDTTDAGTDVSVATPEPTTPPVVDKKDPTPVPSSQPIASSGRDGGCSAAPGAADGGWLLGLVAIAFGRRRKRSSAQ